MFLKLKDILRKEDYKVTDKEVEKAFLETGYHPEQKKHNLTKNYYFENIDNLVEHILFQFPEIRPLKLQKGLYFLFAFYINTYSVEHQKNVIETEYTFPKYLFKADFEAWTYGPVIRDVYLKFKNEEYTPRQYQFSKKDEEFKIFIKDVMEMILEKSDFALVDRVHEDLSWQKAYKNPDSNIIDIKDIEDEYSLINID